MEDFLMESVVNGKFDRVVVIAPTRSTCLNISVVLQNGQIPPTLLMREKGEEIQKAVDSLVTGGFGVVAGTGTGKTVAIRDIAKQILFADLRVDIVTRENEATDYTWTCNVLVVTPGVALHWFKNGVLSASDLVICDEIHQTSEHLELSLALAKRAGCIFLWMSATIDPSIYSKYLSAKQVIECSAFDPDKKAKVETSYDDANSFLSSHVDKFIEEKRGVAVFVPTREQAEKLSAEYSKKDGLYCDFYHGGEKAEKLRQFLTGQVPKPFMVFMTNAGASSLNIQGLDTVVIVDEMYTEVVHSGVRVLEKVKLGNNELLQMGGRVNGRATNGQIFILTSRSIDFHSLTPTTPTFVLGGDLETVALTCARVEVDLGDLDVICQIDRDRYGKIVQQFKNRGIISTEGALTPYGNQVEHLPVSPAWGELLVNAQKAGVENLLDVAIVCASVESLYSLIRKDHKLTEVGVSGSDHLTAHNIVVSALNQFGQITSDNGNGVTYTFRGDYVRNRFNPVTKQQETEKGAFIEWADANGFSAKAIKEATLAMKSIYRQMGLRLPTPESLHIVTNNSLLHESFQHLIAKVQSLDFVHDERNSDAGITVWAAEHSQTKGSDNVLGSIRFWEDKKGHRRATVEGTAVDESILNFYAQKTPVSVEAVTDKGVKIEFKRAFAGETLNRIEEFVADADVPETLRLDAEQKFLNAIRGLEWFGPAVNNNSDVRKMSELYWLRSGGTTHKITQAEEQANYEKVLGGHGIYSVQTTIAAINAGKVDPKALFLKLEDFVSAKEQAQAELLNPEEITVAGKDFHIHYGQIYNETYARTIVLAEFARATEIESIVLPSERIVQLVCDASGTTHMAMSFPELVNQLEASRIKWAWSEARKNHEHTNWISKVDEVLPLLPTILTSVEITKDSAGNPIFGYLSLYSDSDPDFQIRLKESEEETQKETKVGLGRLLTKSCRQMLTVPKEEPYQTKDRWDDWKISEIGSAVKSRFETLRAQYAETADITPETVIAKIDEIKTKAEKIKAEVGGKFVVVQQAVSETETFINVKVEEVASDDRDFVETEVSQARENLKTAKESLKALSYDEATTACTAARAAIGNLPDLINARSAGKEEAKKAWSELEDTLYDIQRSRRDYEGCTESEQERASSLRSAMSDALDKKQYDVVLAKAAEARQLLVEIETRREATKKAEEVLRKHLDEHYADTPFYHDAYAREGGFTTIYDNDPLFVGLQAAIEATDEDSNRYLRLMESRLNGEAVVWLEATGYRDDIEFFIRLKDKLILTEVDLEKIDVVTLWTPPDNQQLRLIQLRREKANYDSEVERAEENEYVIKLAFRLGKNPQGEKQWEAGNKQAKYVVDRYSEFKDQVREGVIFYCYIGKTLIDTGSYRVIAVNPYLAANRNFDSEIAALEAELGVTASDSDIDSGAEDESQPDEEFDLAGAMLTLGSKFGTGRR